MTKRKHRSRSRNTRPDSKVATSPERAAPSSRLPGRRIALVALVIAAAAGITYGLLTRTPESLVLPAPKPADSVISAHQSLYVGRAACISCHAEQDKAWQGSHHDLAMQVADGKAVLGNFANTKFSYAGITSTFFKRDGKFFVNTDGPDGKLTDYEVKYTFGITPLQQYLIEFPGGRYQSLGIAWDTRPKGEGGQRWFHLYPNENFNYKDQLHWTGLYQSWNLQCAACHSTDLKKGYDAASNTYKTTFSEINVSCEACHGPGSRHIEWAKQAKAPFSPQDDKGLAVLLQSRWNEAWKFPESNAKYAQRDKPAADALMNVCSACHSLRSTIAEWGNPGAPLEDTHRLALLTAPNYHADGQQHNEVYIWGSFMQSKMFQRGVTCMDCHEPHALKLRAEGNVLCVSCHNAKAFDTDKHYFHKAGTQGAQCVECHMPAQKYMVIDARRDHSIMVPRPDLSISLGSPNACTQCHADRKPEWAAAAMDKWYGPNWRDRPQYGVTLHAATKQGAKSLPSLLALANDTANSAIVRATAARFAQPYMRLDSLVAAQSLLLDRDPLVRIEALGLLEPFDPNVRAQNAAPLLGDPIRGVRIEAARVIADVPVSQMPANYRDAREHATNEYVVSLRQDADWPVANVNIGNLRLRQGRYEEAIAAYERALFLDARFAGAYVNLADTYRQLGRDAEGENVLRRGLSLLPRAADLHHVLGLLLVRKGDKTAALKELAEAAKLSPDNARYAYVYAVGLHSAGKRSDALAVLREADSRHPYDLDILGALISMNREAGDVKAALRYARRIAEALPDDPGVKRLIADLEGTKSTDL